MSMQLTLFYVGLNSAAPKPWRADFTRYTIAAFCRVPQYKRTKRTLTRSISQYGYQVWNTENAHEQGRLKGSGSFTFYGLHDAREAAIRELVKPEVHQVQIRTDQDRKVYIFNKYDEKIWGYCPE